MKYGKKYSDSIKAVDVSKYYDVNEAVKNVLATAKAKFDETIELHVRLGVDPRQADQQVRGTVILPNGTGKSVKVLVIARGDKAEAALKAGADIVDTALSPLGNGTSQPATEPLVATLQGTPYDTGIDLEVLSEASDYFRKVADRLKADGFLSDKVLKVNIKALMYQVPGGMLSNLINQLKEQNASDKYQEVLEEVPRVRKDLGYPPLVTPTSQIVGTQAVLNVVMGERYKMVTKETKGLLHGEYGTLPAEPDPELYKKVWGDEPRITCRPADLIPPEYEKFKEEVKPYYEQEEDVLSYALFPQVATKFFEQRKAKLHGVDNVLGSKEENIHPV